MVLPEVEEASPDPNSDSFSSDPSSPAYNPDALSSGSDLNSSTITLPSGLLLPIWTAPAIRNLFSQSPRYPNPFTPVPYYSRILGWSDSSRDASITHHINRTQVYIGRPLSSVEAQAESYYHSTLQKILYKSEAIGVVSFLSLAALRQNAARTRPGLITPFARRLLGSTLGDLYITFTRFGIYGVIGRFHGSIIGSIVGSNKIKGMSRNDPNTPELRRDLAEFRNWVEGDVKRKIHEMREGGPKQPLFPTTEEILMRNMSMEKKVHNEKEDVDGEDSGERVLNDDVVNNSYNNGLRLSQKLYKKPDEPLPASFESRSTSGDALANIYDELSVSSTHSPPDSSTRGQANTGESSWDRIRREYLQAAKEGSHSRSGLRASSSEEVPRIPKTDSFTFSDTDRERQLAQAEAQRDFDARVDKERRGERGWVER